MVICPDCGKDVEETKFCKNCGAYLSDVIHEEAIRAANENAALVEGFNDSQSEVYCTNCGLKLDEKFKFCPNCGHDLANQKDDAVITKPHKNMAIAIVFSVIFPGLGQIYLGLDKKGSILLIAFVLSIILILFYIGFVLCAIIWIWALVDTIRSGNALNRGEEVIDKLL